jgi:hypothetical protein
VPERKFGAPIPDSMTALLAGTPILFVLVLMLGWLGLEGREGKVLTGTLWVTPLYGGAGGGLVLVLAG